MLTIKLGTESFRAINGKEVLTVQTDRDFIAPCSIYRNRFPEAKDKKLPPIADTYAFLQEAISIGVVEADCDILDVLIALYLPMRYFQIGTFAKTVKTIGFIGRRGSGKSASATHLLMIDFLLRNKAVFSNMDIAVKVVYKDLARVYQSQRLNTLSLLSLDVGETDGGVVFIDEINMSAAESTRHMSGANLEFSYAMQQIRKMGLNVIYTAQNWDTVDNRVRWQTDFVISCRDAYLDHSYKAKCPGDKSRWRVCDLSGLTGKYDEDYEREKHYILDYEVWKGAVWNKWVWGAFDTNEGQGAESYIAEYKTEQQQKKLLGRLELAAARKLPAADLAERAAESGVESFYADAFWKANGLEGNQGMQQAVGKALKAYFDRHRDTQGKYFYTRKSAETPEMV